MSEEEWNVDNKQDLLKKLPEGYDLVEQTVDRFMKSPSLEILEKFRKYNGNSIFYRVSQTRFFSDQFLLFLVVDQLFFRQRADQHGHKILFCVHVSGSFFE